MDLTDLGRRCGRRQGGAAHARRQVLDGAGLVARQPVDRLRVGAGGGQGRQGRQGEPVAHPHRRRRGGGAHRREGRGGHAALVAVESGAVTPLATAPAAESTPSFSPDGRWVAYEASDVPVRWGGASRIQVVPVGGGAPRALAATFDERPDLLGWTADGTRVIVSETRGTVGRLAAHPDRVHVASARPRPGSARGPPSRRKDR